MSPFDTNTSGYELNDFVLQSKYLNLDIFSSNVSEDDGYEKQFYKVEYLYWALFLIPLPIVAVLGNILVILSVYREKSLQTLTNHFMVSLAVADLLVGAIVMPFALYNLVNDVWDLGTMVCDFYIALDATCTTASILNLAAISVDRYIAVTHPIKYAKHKNSKRVFLMISVVWFVSAAIGSLPIIGYTSIYRKPETCVFYNEDYILFSSIGSFNIPAFIMICLYIRIFNVISERTRKNIVMEFNSRYGEPKSTGSTKLTNDPPTTTSRGQEGQNQVAGLTHNQISKDGLSINPSYGSQDNVHDEDTIGQDNLKQEEAVKVASAIRFSIPADSGYGTSHVENEPQVALAVERDSPKLGCRMEPDSPLLGRRMEHDSPKQAKKLGKQKNNDITNKNKGNDGAKGKTIFDLEKDSLKRERKATKTLAIVLGVFLLCWSPFFECTLMEAFRFKLRNQVVKPNFILIMLTTWTGYFNSCVNPVIYTIFNLEFRKALKKLLSDCRCC